jgi:hypothetical protein
LPAVIATLLVAVAFAVLPIAPHPLVSYPAAPRLLVSTNAAFAEAGDNVTADVYTYLGGVLTDPDSAPNLSASGAKLAVPVEGLARIGSGHYRAYLLLPATSPSLPLSPSNVYLYASATIAGTPTNGGAPIGWITPGPFLRLFSNVSTITDGPPLMHLTAEVYDSAVLVDADPGSVWFYPETFTGPGRPVSANRAALGVYEANLTFPGPVTSSLGAGANATYHGVQLSQTLGNPNANPPAFDFPSYQAWYHLISADQNRVHGELWVADNWGRPAPGVLVSLIPSSNVTVRIAGTTDASGRFPLDLNLTGGMAGVSGTVGGLSPMAIKVIGTFPPRSCDDTPSLFSNSQSVIPVDPPLLGDRSLRDYLESGATVTRHYRAVNPYGGQGMAPLANTSMNYYVTGGSTGSVYAAGHAVTDAGGNFSLQFNVPDEDVRLIFDVEGVLSSTLVYSVPSPLMGLRVSPLRLGGPTSVNTSFAGRRAIYAYSGSLFSMGLVQAIATSGERWVEWGPGRSCAHDFLRESAGGLNATFYLPSFLPTSGIYLVNTWAYAEATGGSEWVEQYVLLSPGESADIPVGGPGNTGLGLMQIVWWVAIGLALAAIAAAGLAWVLRRRRGLPPAPPPPPTR